MNLHLLVPSLFWPEPALPELYRDLPLSALENLLAKCSYADGEPQEVEAWLCRTFGIAKQEDWPVAPITLQTDGPEHIKAGSDYWIRADPVHLRIERNQVVLADSRVFHISPQEADELTALLNRHFRAAGQETEFLPLRPDRWYLRATETQPVKTHLLSEAANQGINELLPSGINSAFWRSLFNEVQMLLHEHPLNELREARGEPAINGVWFWGGGIVPQSLTCSYTHVWSNDVLSGSLALACGVNHAQLPPDAGIWQQSHIAGNHLVLLGALHGQAQYADAYGWRESLRELERNWFAPLWAMAKLGKFDQISLTALGEKTSRSFTAGRADFRKFWRRTKPISTYAGYDPASKQ
ncbi:phosphoglycerate mutase [Nitrosovibrio sp. Nv6]|uniref:phosphoglycerate mutase n=1 Tax=Nitrosovibrio sp. Nv6 TaxID=1855340 RepID=UPI0008CD1EE0|nr:phosphoglycerate mutase [Nitrosovibrio sp. Nv6]SEP24275.1 hypothetical protein SAMN05216316_2109 [Nitrosovibrio sp. Nv6]